MSDQDDRAGHFSKPHLDALEDLRTNTTFLWQSLLNLRVEDDRLVCQVRNNTYDTIRDALATLEKAGYFKVSVRVQERPKGRRNHAALPARRALFLTLEEITTEFKRSVVSHFKPPDDEPFEVSTPEEPAGVHQLAEIPARPGSSVASNTVQLCQLHCAPLALSEIIPASLYYPVLFPKEDKEESLALAPVALFSLSSEDGNAYIDADGRWTAPFIPYSVRQSLDPAEFLPSPENPSGEAVSRAVSIDKQEDALWCFKKEQKEAAQLAELLHNELELCEDPAGLKCADAYRVVSEERLAELPKEKFLILRNRGLLPYIYAHLSSLEHLHILQLRASFSEKLEEDCPFAFEHSVTGYPVEKVSLGKRLLPLSHLAQKPANSHVWMWRIAGMGALLLVARIGWTTLFSPPLISEPETVSVRGGSRALQNVPGQSRLMDEARQNAAEQNILIPEAPLPAITQPETVPSVVPLKSAGSVKEENQYKLVAPRKLVLAAGQVKVAEKVPRNSSPTSTSSQETDPSLTSKNKPRDKQLDRKQLESDRPARALDKPDAVANNPLKESPSKVKVAADILNMRILPDLQQTIVTRLEKGTVLKVIGLENAWLQVETSDGRTGWVAGYLTTDLRTGRPALPLL